MDVLLVIGWVIWLLAAAIGIVEVFGYAGLTRMFPEGRRWWHGLAQLAALAFFAAAVLCHPWQ